MTMLLKAICRFNAIPVKIPKAFFKELEEIILKFVQKHTQKNTKSHNTEKEQD